MSDYLYIEKGNKLYVKEKNLEINCTINGFWKTLIMNNKCNGIFNWLSYYSISYKVQKCMIITI